MKKDTVELIEMTIQELVALPEKEFNALGNCVAFAHTTTYHYPIRFCGIVEPAGVKDSFGEAPLVMLKNGNSRWFFYADDVVWIFKPLQHPHKTSWFTQFAGIFRRSLI